MPKVYKQMTLKKGADTISVTVMDDGAIKMPPLSGVSSRALATALVVNWCVWAARRKNLPL